MDINSQWHVVAYNQHVPLSYFSKATTLDRVYGPAWLAFGHSFAVENEHDQAMAAYFTASQLMKGLVSFVFCIYYTLLTQGVCTCITQLRYW